MQNKSIFIQFPWRGFRQTFVTVFVLSSLMYPSAKALDLAFVEAAPGIYVHIGKHEEMAVKNFGDIANIGFIVGNESVAVIDPGGSPRVGEAMRNAIRTITKLPISHVILTHIHPDHIFGGSAFSDVDRVVAHMKFSRALMQRGNFYRDAYQGLFKDSNTATTLSPNLAVTDSLRIDLGGRDLLVQAHATAHTDHDLSVFDEQSQTLWASDLVFGERIPSLDGSLPGWLKVLDRLAKLEPELVIPGHGAPDSWAKLVKPQQRYLGKLLQQTRQFIADNKRLSSAVESVAIDEKQHWLLYDSQHRGNITRAYTELEWE